MDIVELAKKAEEYVLKSKLSSKEVVRRFVATNSNGSAFMDVLNTNDPDLIYFEVTAFENGAKVRKIDAPGPKKQLNMKLSQEVIDKLTWISDQQRRSMVGTIEWMIEKEYREITGE